MLQISTADILKIVLPTVITLFIAVVKTPFRIRRENHDKLLNLLESVEKSQSAPIRLLRFRDYIGNRSAGLVALQLLLALPDSVAALERYRFTGGRQQILRATPAGFVLRPSANNAFKRFFAFLSLFLAVFGVRYVAGAVPCVDSMGTAAVRGIDYALFTPLSA